MKRPAAVTWLVAFAFVSFGSVPCMAQQQKEAEKKPLNHSLCKVYFTVYQMDAHIPGGIAPGMHKDQKEWYEKTLVKKYPTVCMSAEKATYAIVWSNQPPSRSATIVTGDVNAVINPYEPNRVWMSVFPSHGSAETSTTTPFTGQAIYATHQESRWTYRVAHRKALEEAVKFLSGLAEK